MIWVIHPPSPALQGCRMRLLIPWLEHFSAYPFFWRWWCSVTVVTDSLQPHGLLHPRLPFPSLSPRVSSNSCPLSLWCSLLILSLVIPFSSSVAPISSCPQSFPVSLPVGWLPTSGGQSTGASASASVLPVNIQGWFPLGLTGLISVLSKGLSRVFSSITVQKHQFFIKMLFSSSLLSAIRVSRLWCSVAQSCPTLCNPVDCRMLDFPVFHCFPEFAQTRICWVDDALQLSHPLSSPSLPAFNLSQHQGLFQWVSSSHQVAKIFELQF